MRFDFLQLAIVFGTNTGGTFLALRDLNADCELYPWMTPACREASMKPDLANKVTALIFRKVSTNIKTHVQ